MRVTLDELPAVFRIGQAIEHGASKRDIYDWRNSGKLATVRRGVFAKIDVDDDTLRLSEIGLCRPAATLCLTSALERYDLTDEIPQVVDVALARGTRPLADIAHVEWHFFEPTTFHIGRKKLTLNTQVEIGIFNVERTIVDVFRLRHLQGEEVAYETLRRWLRRPGSQPSSLLAMARNFPKTESIIRHALEVLL